MHWIINDNIEFRPDSKKLISVTNPEINVVLTTPASRCLLLLLEASPDVVTQQEFFKKVWEDEGMLVPANTLYQNISIVRRGLRAVGETDQILVATVPRKGFQIDKSVRITRVAAAQATEATDTLQGEDELDVEYDTDAGPELTPEDTALPARTVTVSQRSRLPFFVGIIAMLAAFFIGAIGTNVVWHFNDTKPFFAGYTFVEQDKGCHFYTTDDSHDNKNSYARFKALILGSGLDCEKYPWVYFPLSQTSPGLAVLVCRKNYLKSAVPGCITLSFRGAGSE
ncbi:winged helix-turn-helix domain-containing protein [Citrobacter farmeri]|uniref:Regulatory protein n=1 Tax=Citrobacter amalonaticus Y19 TaxID=1261127 RepID=A0A0F6TW77_CITAM|nr:transcriptional regulator [Citrobacter amalonaticus]AKE59872.1 regulatory protein [Citrobacter amalonaticus Y19]EKV5652918.1 transcriptional regulator [Citrobacter farmeri]